MEEVTKVLPAIALRGTTILPDMIVHFDISRPKSVRAVEEAMLGDQKIFLITQKDPDTEVPGLLDVYKIGTIAVIKQVVRMPKDVLRILVEAERRAELLNFEEEESEYLRAEVALFTGSDEMQFSDIEQEAMLRNLKELFAVYCEQTQKVSKELAGEIQEQSVWLMRLMENILNMTKLESEEFEIRKNQEVVDDLIYEAVSHIIGLREKRRFEIKLPSELIVVNVDGKLMVQVLVNLLDNAMKHTGENGWICIEARYDAGKVWISVEDDGDGIQEDLKENIFDEFVIYRS